LLRRKFPEGRRYTQIDGRGRPFNSSKPVSPEEEGEGFRREKRCQDYRGVRGEKREGLTAAARDAWLKS